MNAQHGGSVSGMSHGDGFYNDLSPNRIEGILQMYGLSFPKREDGQEFCYLEIGYGQGISLNVHAAACAGEFWGTDANPNNCLSARRLQAQSGAKGQMLNDSIEELYEKSKNGTLPQFDMIALHGVWSWVAQESRAHLLHIISTNLKPGGVVFLSYNCMPGWASFAPLRELLTYHANAESGEKNTLAKMKNAFTFVDELEKNGAHYFMHNPSAAARFKKIGEQSIPYVAHEYFNKEWYAPYFKDVASDLESAKCTFFSSTQLLTQLGMALPEKLQTSLREVSDVKLRETMRDFALNTGFRTDIFVKGAARSAEKLDEIMFALCVAKEHARYSILSHGGQLELKKEFYEPLVEFFAKDGYAPKSIAQLQEAFPQLNLHTLREALSVLLGCNSIQLAKKVTEEQGNSCKKLNGEMYRHVLSGAPMVVLASPVLGGGIYASSSEVMLLADMQKESADNKEKRVEKLFDLFKAQGKVMKKEDTVLSDEECKEELLNFVQHFEDVRLPLFQGLGVEVLLPE